MKKERKESLREGENEEEKKEKENYVGEIEKE